MPDREEKHVNLADHQSQGLYTALDGLKHLNTDLFNLAAVANQITSVTRSVLKVPCTALWLVDDQHKFISLQAFSCADSIETNPKKYNLTVEDEDSPVAICYKEGKPSIHKKLTLAEMDPRTVILTKSYISAVLPLCTPTGVIGVFEVITAANDGFTGVELKNLEVLATQIALQVSNLQAFDRSARLSELQKQLYEITAKINQAQDIEYIMNITVEGISKALDLPGASMHVNLTAVNQEPNS